MSHEDFPAAEQLTALEKAEAFGAQFLRAFFDIPSVSQIDAIGYRQRGLDVLESHANSESDSSN